MVDGTRGLVTSPHITPHLDHVNLYDALADLVAEGVVVQGSYCGTPTWALAPVPDCVDCGHPRDEHSEQHDGTPTWCISCGCREYVDPPKTGA